LGTRELKKGRQRKKGREGREWGETEKFLVLNRFISFLLLSLCLCGLDYP
jgi:hypothetical protein